MGTYDRIIEQAEERLRANESIQAMQLYAEAAAVAPDRKEPLIELAQLFIDHDDIEGAAGFLEKALTLDRADVFIRLNLALAYFELEHAERAMLHLKEAVLLIQYIVAGTRIDETFGRTTETERERAAELETTGEYALELLKELAGLAELQAGSNAEPEVPSQSEPFATRLLRLAS
jgi:tetratricopeptide (TPR) repeat protein